MAAIIAGKEPRSLDPAVSEWGNPLGFIPEYWVVKQYAFLLIKAVLECKSHISNVKMKYQKVKLFEFYIFILHFEF